MKLRARMFVTVAVGAVPLVVAVIWFDARDRHQAARKALEDVTTRYMLDGNERARCEASPATWGGRPMPPPDAGRARVRRDPSRQIGPGFDPPVLFAYDERLRSANPAAPPLAGPPDEPVWPGPRVQTLVAMPWLAGPCAYVLARGSWNPRWVGALLPQSRIWLLPIGAALVALLLSAGPVVGRIRRLTGAVRASAAADFTAPVPVEGNDEVAELAVAFRAASREVQKQLEARDRRERALRDYLANTTHDVMIPLTVLQSHLATIHEQRLAGGEVDLGAIVHAMNEAHYLGALAHNLAAAATLDAGEPAIARSPVDLGALVDRVLARHRPVARQLGVALDGAVPEEAVEVVGDVTLLEQAVNNVVYNSIRYNRTGGSVGVTLDRIAGDRFRLRVVDDGPGIPEADLSRLAERGFRGSDARGRAPDGKGLGLSIAFRVADLLGMALRFARSEYGGLQVDLVGPVSRRPPPSG
ncbi:MAG TPA: HAMP domain-containing sensor histidine kinase [Candidatus Acidoferrum sp.]|nr:HAMP domain-containing sensor histidine kinase [Candidatus Acidoferrum sp.]